MKQYQISEKLFLDLCRYHLAGLKDPDLEENIRAGLQDKVNYPPLK